MNAYKLILAFLGSLLVFGSVQAAEQEHKPYVGSEAFERMKELVGSWEGTMDMGKGPERITASYKLTSGGSAIVETVFEGAPHEMITVYHDDHDNTLAMTHYCSLGNQPKMVLRGMEGNVLVFDLSKQADIDVAKDRHMHAVSITLNGGSMTQRWTQYNEGKQGKSVEIAYTRIE